ncbi:MAG: hypothetical protein QG597_4775, partial [Actinomycetota bacterium]|nr:hypothetical protein [Actinomycetota bacterium]
TLGVGPAFLAVAVVVLAMGLVALWSPSLRAMDDSAVQ